MEDTPPIMAGAESPDPELLGAVVRGEVSEDALRPAGERPAVPDAEEVEAWRVDFEAAVSELLDPAQVSDMRAAFGSLMAGA